MNECLTCKYWTAHIRHWERKPGAIGECRAMPPTASPGAQERALWPKTTAEDWCGAYVEVEASD